MNQHNNQYTLLGKVLISTLLLSNILFLGLSHHTTQKTVLNDIGKLNNIAYISVNSSETTYEMLTPTTVPIGGKIAYVSGWSIYTLNEDNLTSQCLTICDSTAPANPNTAPAWSPDGQHIAFKASRNGTWSFYIIDANGQNLHKLTDYDSNTTDVGNDPPSWSPDGKMIAFATFREQHWGIYVINIDGSNTKLLISMDTSIRSPSWSSDGQHLVFSSPKGISVIDRDGSHLKLLTDEGNSPAWSPDGRHIAFMSTRDSVQAVGWSIYIMDSDGSNLRRLIRGENIVDSPTWSPDGQHIAFMAQPDENNDSYYGNIYVVDIDGSNFHQLTHEGGWSPAWSTAN